MHSMTTVLQRSHSMKIKDILTERIHTNVLCVDIQPEYADWCDEIASDAAEFLNKQTGKIVILYNGEGQTSDTSSDVVDYLYKYGFDPAKNNFSVISKNYGFFRAWMDSNVSPTIILKVIREMVMRRMHDSEQLNLEDILDKNEMNNLDRKIGYNTIWGKTRYDNIYLPDFMTVAQLRNLSPFYLIGGGRYQCVAEIELICNAFNIRYKRIDKLIY